jgi:hypothetical protein
MVLKLLSIEFRENRSSVLELSDTYTQTVGANLIGARHGCESAKNGVCEFENSYALNENNHEQQKCSPKLQYRCVLREHAST